jgi:hypothetical protein
MPKTRKRRLADAAAESVLPPTVKENGLDPGETPHGFADIIKRFIFEINASVVEARD